jgi:hypothetical protein
MTILKQFRRSENRTLSGCNKEYELMKPPLR